MSHDTLLSLMVTMFGIAIASPFLVMLLQNRNRKADRDEDRQHRDDVASTLLASNAHVATVAAEVAARTQASLDGIHTLVNSNLTRAIAAERDAVAHALASIQQVIELKVAHGIPVIPGSTDVQAQLATQLAALEASLRDRRRETQEMQGESDST